MVQYHITPYAVPSPGILFVDHQKEHRTGHLSHALVEYSPGKVLSFYSNCSGNRVQGHNGFGWIEYRRSVDGARTWGKTLRLEYSWNAFLNEPYTISCEKASSPRENEIVLFCTRNAGAQGGWGPYLTPTWLKSTDGGETWKEMGELSPYSGRIFDSLVVNGTIYVLHFCNPCDVSFDCNKSEHTYRLYKSEDAGETFTECGVFPEENLLRRAYGTMELLPDGRLIIYTYNYDDEFNADYFITSDFGKTWDERGTSYLAKRIRNPQIGKVRGGYILHGRSGCTVNEWPIDLVLYTSEDGIHWDEGTYIGHVEQDKNWSACAYYSNNLVLNEGEKQRVLIQSSVSYYAGDTNVAHWFLDMD